MSNECGFTCLGCGQFRPGPEGAHSEAACLRVQLAAANEEIGRLRLDVMFCKNALADANERVGRMERALTLLIYDLDKCPTRQRGGASGQTVENNIAGQYITGLPVACVERARKALEVPDAM